MYKRQCLKGSEAATGLKQEEPQSGPAIVRKVESSADAEIETKEEELDSSKEAVDETQESQTESAEDNVSKEAEAPSEEQDSTTKE